MNAIDLLNSTLQGVISEKDLIEAAMRPQRLRDDFNARERIERRRLLTKVLRDATVDCSLEILAAYEAMYEAVGKLRTDLGEDAVEDEEFILPFLSRLSKVYVVRTILDNTSTLAKVHKEMILERIIDGVFPQYTPPVGKSPMPGITTKSIMAELRKIQPQQTFGAIGRMPQDIQR